ncbi:MAG TPA: transposase [Chthoniobacterales bacterium]
MEEEVTDPEALIRLLRVENHQLKAQNELLQRENALQKEKINLLIRRLFGVKSEQLNPAQLELLLSQAGTPSGKGVASAEAEAAPLLEAVKGTAHKERDKRPHRERWPEDLPVLEELLEPEEVKTRPEAFRCIGREVSETLDYEPARFFRRMIYERLQRVLTAWQLRGRVLPQSSLGQAIRYALGQWSSLAVYLHDGTIEIDNNLVENAIRPTAVGKKNWLFVGEAEAGPRSAVLYTIIENCRRRDVEPYTYLRDVLTRLPQMTNWQIKDITPKAWAKAKTATTRRAA